MAFVVHALDKLKKIPRMMGIFIPAWNRIDAPSPSPLPVPDFPIIHDLKTKSFVELLACAAI